MPDENDMNRQRAAESDGSEAGSGGANWIEALGQIAASEEAAGARDTIEVVLAGRYNRSPVFPAERPPWRGGVDESDRNKWLGRARDGLGVFPSAERLGAYYYLQHKNDPESGWRDAAVLSANPGRPPQKRVDAVMWDLYTMDGYRGRSDIGLNTGAIGGSGNPTPGINIPLGPVVTSPIDVVIVDDDDNDNDDDNEGTSALLIGGLSLAVAVGLGLLYNGRSK